MIRSVWPSLLVGIVVGEAAVLLHARKLTGGEQTLWGWALGWQVLLVSLAVGLGGLFIMDRFRTAGLALAAATIVAALHIFAGVELPGYEVGVRIVGASGSSPTRPRPPTVTNPRPCGDLHFIGVRGSGATSRDGLGYGAVVNDFRTWLEIEIGSDRSIDRTALEYPAAAVETLPDPAFFASFEDGAEGLTQQVQSSLSDCPDRPIVLSGHSQGAAVIRMTLSALAPNELESIAAVVLFADPARLAGAAENRGDIGGSDGSFLATGATLPGLPTALEGRVQSWCFASDIVCAWDATSVLVFMAGPPSMFHTVPYQEIARMAAIEAGPLVRAQS